jgi:hypothetical protein
MEKGAPAFPGLGQKPGVKFIVGPLVLGAEHESITVVEADRVEAVDNFVIQSALVQWNTVKVSSAMTMEEAMKMMPSLPPLY